MSWPWHTTGHCHPPCSPVPRAEGSIPTSLHECSWDACPHNIIITSWPDDIKSVPCPLHPYWQHSETLTIEDGLVLHGEALVVPSLERESTATTVSVPPRIHQGPVACMWMHLLAQYKQSHWRSCPSVWDLHLVPSPECCSTPHTYTNSILPMADVHHRHLYPRRSWLPHMQWLLLENDPHPMSSIWPEQHHQSHLTAQGNVLRVWNPRSPLLWQWSTIGECPVHWFLHFLGYHPMRSWALTTHNHWICRGMCKISEACTPTC